MKKLLTVAAALFLTFSGSAHAAFFIVFKASIMAPVTYVSPLPPTPGGKHVTKTLAAKEFINLTLGLPLDTPLSDATHDYILALVLNYEPDSRRSGASDPEVQTGSLGQGAARR